MLNLKKNIFFFIFITSLFSSILIFSKSLDFYFFQDDFFHLRISKAANFAQYLNFYKYRTDIIGYRPVSIQNYFFWNFRVFSLNPVGFRFTTFIAFLFSAFLIAKIIKMITKKSEVALLTASFWLVSSIHFMSITWISASYTIVGTLFWLLSAFCFIKWAQKGKKLFYLCSLIFYLITLATYEFAVTWLPIIMLYYFIYKRRNILKDLKIFLPFIVPTLLYVYVKLFMMKIPQIPEYQTALNSFSAKALFWYFLWSLNVPEEFKKQIVGKLIFFNPIFVSEYKLLLTKVFLSFFLIVLTGLIIPALKFIKSGNWHFNFIAFSLLWFIFAVFPVLLLPNHTFIMYLTLASIGIYSLISFMLYSSGSFPLVIVTFLIFTFGTITTVTFYQENFWMIEAEKFTSNISQNLIRQFPSLPKNAVVLYQGVNPRERQAASNQEIIKAFYKDPTLSIYYNKDELKNFLKNGNRNPVFVYIP